MCLSGEIIRFPKRGAMCFSESEKERYFKQIRVRDWKQEKLKSSKVLIVGMGGLGCASALYLTAAGIGKLRLCDGDKIQERDLNRQVLYSQESVGKLKVEEAKKRLVLLNPEVEFEISPEFLNSQNADRMTKDCNMIVDGLDNNESRFILNLQSVRKRKPYVYGAVQGWEGFVGVFHPPKTACIACILPKETLGPDDTPVPGVLPGIVGVLQATEVLKFLMGVELTLLSRLLVYDSKNLTFDVVETEKNPICPHCAVT
jgi:molybdopterin/thiamine biosynthesis adenylyltransferase